VPPVPQRLTRAELFSGGARAGTALALAGAGLGAFAARAGATPPNDALGLLPAPDLAYARLLIGWELLTIDFYTHALASKHLDRASADVARLAVANEQAHYTYLAGVLAGAGDVALTAADVSFTYPATGFYTARSVTHLALTLEGLALGTYLGAGGNVATPALSSAIAQIAANEAQHLSVLSLNDGVSAFRDAFPATMTMEDSSNALDNYTS
jgi:hypothetical protein